VYGGLAVLAFACVEHPDDRHPGFDFFEIGASDQYFDHTRFRFDLLRFAGFVRNLDLTVSLTMRALSPPSFSASRSRALDSSMVTPYPPSSFIATKISQAIFIGVRHACPLPRSLIRWYHYCMSIRVTTKKHRRGRPVTTGKGLQIGMRWHEPLLGMIDDWAAAQDDEPSRTEAIRRLVERGLAAERPSSRKRKGTPA
jgi:hypothetical protein